MSEPVCNRCGQPGIVWAYRSSTSDTFHPPLEPIDPVLIIDRKGVVREVGAYKTHVCLAAAVAEWTPLTPEQLRERSAEQHELRKQDFTDDAETRPCAKCGAEIGHPCLNLTQLRRGIQQPTSWPHYERYPSQVEVV